MRVAHFVNYDNLAASPPNRAIIEILLNCGCQVDVYGPGNNFQIEDYGPNVSSCTAHYTRSWLLKNMFNPKWRQYAIFSGTAEDPLCIVGTLSSLWRKPSFALMDEIKSDGYYGNRAESWKKLARWSIRRTDFQIVNDPSRKDLLKDYLATQALDLIVYPGCYHNPPEPANREKIRKKWGVSESDLVIADSGVFYHTHSAPWLLHALAKRSDIQIVLQALYLDPMTKLLLGKIQGHERLYLEPEQLNWRQSWSEIVGADIGVAAYHQQGRQFQLMGISSNRLCMFLAMGLPVIVSKQKSFEFLEKYECGVMVENETEFLDAVDFIASRLDEMKKNALICAQKYIDAPGAYEKLRSRIEKLVDATR